MTLSVSTSDLKVNREVLSVSDLNRKARNLLESKFASVIVEGEISNLAMPASGHWYFTLKDKKSQLRCAMFRHNNQRVAFSPRNGIQVEVRGKLSIYEGRGDYQLITDNMSEAGEGDLRLAFDLLKKKLGSEGLFAPEHKQPIGNDYRHIGIITSRTGAAIQDMLSVFARRFPSIRLTLFSVAVQGQQAPAEIVNAINRANRLGPQLGIEALIVGRGGGSLEDLQAFNEETVARAMFASKLPITSAVGHETDFTIADFVADVRAPTPSAAAELMSPHQQHYLDRLTDYQQKLLTAVTNTIANQNATLQWLTRQLKRPDRRLQENAQTLDRLESQIKHAMINQLQRHRTELNLCQRTLAANSPVSLLRDSTRRLESGRHQLRAAIKSQLLQANGRLEQLVRNLNAISPLAVLARGYSLTSDDNNALLRNSKQVQLDDRIQTRLADGHLTSIVTAVHPESGTDTEKGNQS